MSVCIQFSIILCPLLVFVLDKSHHWTASNHKNTENRQHAHHSEQPPHHYMLFPWAIHLLAVFPRDLICCIQMYKVCFGQLAFPPSLYYLTCHFTCKTLPDQIFQTSASCSWQWSPAVVAHSPQGLLFYTLWDAFLLTVRSDDLSYCRLCQLKSDSLFYSH